MVVLIILVFVIGYVCIAMEHALKVNKAAFSLVTGVLCWTIYILFTPDKKMVVDELAHHLGELSQILFFLMGAMAIVELIDAHYGFDIITKRITTRNKKKLIWIICVITFILSAILDNLTTTIVMVSLVQKLMTDKKNRLMFCGAIVISANAGGAWSPIGDVTTTMLWIGGQITAFSIIAKLILPSLVCMALPITVMQYMLKGEISPPPKLNEGDEPGYRNHRHRNIVFAIGVSILLLVPVFKTVTHLQPFMGILIGLGLLWVIVEILHRADTHGDRNKYSVTYALRKIDTPSILFFLGILLAISAMESTHLLRYMAGWLETTLKNNNLIVLCIGLLSSIVDNVPLVAATMGMYDLQQYPTDHTMWEFLAYCTGTGGSALIIGSAAGVAAMGIEKIVFTWYLKNITWLALIGYFAGAIVYILQENIF